MLSGLYLPMKVTVMTFDWQGQEVRAHDELWIYIFIIVVRYNREKNYLLHFPHLIFSQLQKTERSVTFMVGKPKL